MCLNQSRSELLWQELIACPVIHYSRDEYFRACSQPGELPDDAAGGQESSRKLCSLCHRHGNRTQLFIREFAFPVQL